jgi:phosphoribosylformylglycinamidine synthase PurS subunit
MHVRVLVRNRPGVFDPAGKVVQSGLRRLGHHVEHVHLGKVIDLQIEGDDRDAVRAEIDLMCKEFLVNPVLENYSVEFLDDEGK